MSIRQILVKLLTYCGPLDDSMQVRIVRREPEGNSVTHIAMVPIVYVNMDSSICIEETDIKWEPYL